MAVFSNSLFVSEVGQRESEWNEWMDFDLIDFWVWWGAGRRNLNVFEAAIETSENRAEIHKLG
jgi:hypothetical protein